jgi:hypothetical protein
MSDRKFTECWVLLKAKSRTTEGCCNYAWTFARAYLEKRQLICGRMLRAQAQGTFVLNVIAKNYDLPGCDAV